MRLLLIFCCLFLCFACGSTPGTTSDAGTSDAGSTTTEPLKASKVNTSATVVAAYVTVLPSGNVVIADYTTPGVFEVKPDGTVVTSNTTAFSLGGNTPGALSANASGGVAVRRGFKGVVSFSGALGTAPVDFLSTAKDVNALTWGANGKFYTFTGRPNGTLEVYNAATAAAAGSGTTVASIAGTIGAVAVDSSGTAYVLDGGSCSITRVKSSGETKTIINNPAAGSTRCAVGAIQEGYIGQAGGLAVDALGRLIVSDTQNHRVLRIAIGADDSTTTVNLYENSEFNPTDVAVAPNGDLFVVDSKTKAVWRLAP